VPVDVPAPGEYVADGAARQAAWVLSGSPEPPSWQQQDVVTYEAEPTPTVLERYREAAQHVARSQPS
jgi:xylulokinase